MLEKVLMQHHKNLLNSHYSMKHMEDTTRQRM